MTDYDRILLVKNEVFVYKIGPRANNRGYRAADWTLDKPDWTGRLRVLSRGTSLWIKLEDKVSGELFAKCPVEAMPSAAVEPVLDSSRYFVIRLVDENDRHAFVGLGFADRNDSFDLNVTIQDHFKSLKQEHDAAENERQHTAAPKLDLAFKEGQTIRINLNTKKIKGNSGDDAEGARAAAPTQRPHPTGGAAFGGGIGLLPPPPSSGGSRHIPPPLSSSSSSSSPFSSSSSSSNPFGAPSSSSSADPFSAAFPTSAISSKPPPPTPPKSATGGGDLLLDFS